MGLKALLSRHKIIGVDTVVFIYYLENHPLYAPLLAPLFSAWEEGGA